MTRKKSIGWKMFVSIITTENQRKKSLQEEKQIFRRKIFTLTSRCWKLPFDGHCLVKGNRVWVRMDCHVEWQVQNCLSLWFDVVRGIERRKYFHQSENLDLPRSNRWRFRKFSNTTLSLRKNLYPKESITSRITANERNISINQGRSQQSN